MCHSESTSLEESNCDVTRFAVTDACIFYSHGITVKEWGHVKEVYSMVADIRLTFVFVLLKFHIHIVVTIRSYVKGGAECVGQRHGGERRSTTTGGGKIVGFGKRYSIRRLFVGRVFAGAQVQCIVVTCE